MNILVCNDDGINSEGLIVLAKCLSREHNVLVVAPDGNRSAYAHSISISKDIKVEEVFIDESFRSFSVSGTPADCVKYAHHVFPEFGIELVCSGVNKGNNLGTDVIYSGTVSAGLEANSLGLPAIAFSNTSFCDNRFDVCGVIALKIVDKLRKNLSCEYTYNVNIPNEEEADIKGYKFTKLGVQIYTDEYISTGDKTFRLIGDPVVHDKNDEDCDVEWNRKGYVTITPILFDKTDYKALSRLVEEVEL
ncbi:MAG: 5'/3'-nucleotidase SurE [Clostridia bacterium]|nr:5'/3'-nucleotidase SurE [Clostridia bacterium]